MKRRARLVTTFAFVAALAGLGACTAILGDFTTSPPAVSDSGPGADVLTETSVVGDGGLVLSISAPSSALVQPGKTASVAITATGNTTGGPITVNVSGLPTGVTAGALTINGSSGNLILTAAASATPGTQAAASVTATESGTTTTPIGLNVIVSGPSGSVDTTFPAVLPFSSGLGTITSGLLQPDGKILLVGTFHTNPSDAPQLVIRLNADGTRDTTYQSLIVTNASASPIAQGLKALLQPDGKVLVAWTEGASSYVNVTRLTTSGALDGTWHDPTKATASTFDQTFAATSPELMAFGLGSDGSVVYAQYVSSGSINIWRWTSSGNPDTTIGTLGDYGRTELGPAHPAQAIDELDSLQTVTDGGVIFAGFGANENGFSTQVFARTTAALTDDVTFGPLPDAGRGAAGGWDTGFRNALAYDSLLVGNDLYEAIIQNNAGCSSEVQLCVSKWTLGPDAHNAEESCPDFATSGLGCGDVAVRIAPGPNKTIVVGGFSGTAGGIPVVVRYTTGPLKPDTSFGTAGVAKLRASGSAAATETPGAVLVSPEGLIYSVNQDTQYPIQRVWP